MDNSKFRKSVVWTIAIIVCLVIGYFCGSFESSHVQSQPCEIDTVAVLDTVPVDSEIILMDPEVDTLEVAFE